LSNQLGVTVAHSGVQISSKMLTDPPVDRGVVVNRASGDWPETGPLGVETQVTSFGSSLAFLVESKSTRDVKKHRIE
jgi:hypothetical protein